MPYQSTPAQQSTPKQLGQSRPGNTTAASLYSPADGVVAEITGIVVAETAGTGAAFRICHDEDGTTYDETTALYWDTPVAANTSIEREMSIYMVDPSGNLSVRTDTAGALTFTVYGLETRIRAR